ncbi:MAG TPA: rod shape-determining protein MreD [Bryobacteraceae bacterium]|jgi:rod shape-determining protein MreD
MAYSSGRMLLSQSDGPVSRFRAWVFVVIPLLAILFQVYVPLFFPVLSFLEMPLLVVVYLSLTQRSQVGGLFTGALIGLAQDSLSKNPLGMFGICKTLVGYFAASVGVHFNVDNTVIRLFLSFLFYFFHQTLYWVMQRMLLAQQPPFDYQSWILFGALNAVVGVFLFHFLDKLRAAA